MTGDGPTSSQERAEFASDVSQLPPSSVPHIPIEHSEQAAEHVVPPLSPSQESDIENLLDPQGSGHQANPLLTPIRLGRPPEVGRRAEKEATNRRFYGGMRNPRKAASKLPRLKVAMYRFRKHMTKHLMNIGESLENKLRGRCELLVA